MVYYTNSHWTYQIQYVQYGTCWGIWKFATCGNDVEDAWLLLLTGHVVSPAHDSSVVHFRHRCVSQHGLRHARPTSSSGCSVAGLGYIDCFSRVVEGPFEAVGWRVSLYLARHVCIFVTGYSVHALLVWPTDRFVCKQQIGYCYKLIYIPDWKVGCQTVKRFTCRCQLMSNEVWVATILLAILRNALRDKHFASTHKLSFSKTSTWMNIWMQNHQITCFWKECNAVWPFRGESRIDSAVDCRHVRC